MATSKPLPANEWERGYVEGIAAGRRDMTRDVLLSAKTMTREMLIAWLEGEAMTKPDITTLKPLPVDEDGCCHTLPNGECISPGPCPHTPGFYDKPEDKGWQWWWANTMEDESYQGPFETEALALIDAQNKSKRDSFIVFEAKRHVLDNDCFDADLVIEAFHEHNSDMADPDGQLQMDPTTAQKLELEEALTVLAAWRQKHGLGRAWLSLDTRGETTVTLNTNRGELP
jgi:hypothetical protein